MVGHNEFWNLTEGLEQEQMGEVFFFVYHVACRKRILMSIENNQIRVFETPWCYNLYWNDSDNTGGKKWTTVNLLIS